MIPLQSCSRFICYCVFLTRWSRSRKPNGPFGFGLRIPKTVHFWAEMSISARPFRFFSENLQVKNSSKLSKKAKFLQWMFKIYSVLIRLQKLYWTNAKLISIANFYRKIKSLSRLLNDKLLQKYSINN